MRSLIRLMRILAPTLIIALFAGVANAQEYASQTPAEWRRQLTEPESYIERSRAAYVLGRLKEQRPEAVAALTEALRERNLVVRWYAANSLGLLGNEAKPAIPQLLKSLESTANDKDVYRNVVRSLGQIGEATPEIVDALTKASESEDRLLAVLALESQLRIGAGGSAYEQLLKSLEGDNATEAFAAIQALERLTELRKPPTERVAKLLGHSSSDVRRVAARLLGREGWSAAPLVVAAIKSGVPADTCFAALSYDSKEPGAAAKEAQQQAIELALARISDPDQATRRAAASFLTRQGVATLRAVVTAWPKQTGNWQEPTLAMLGGWLERTRGRFAKDPDWKSSADVGERLLELLTAEERLTRRMTLWMLAELPLPLDANQLDANGPLLRECLRDQDVFNRRNAASILRRRPNNAEQ